MALNLRRVLLECDWDDITEALGVYLRSNEERDRFRNGLNRVMEVIRNRDRARRHQKGVLTRVANRGNVPPEAPR